MPLVRYRSGDYVVAGGDCPCGRCLPTIAAFAGRKEHRFTFPDGSSRLPAIDRVAISEALGHDRWQFVQTEAANAELRHEPATGHCDRAHLHELAARPLGEGWQVKLNETTSVPPTKAGKRHFTVNAVA
jgi:phenylacetate-CoA ligase